MPSLIDLTGQTFGRLKVLHRGQVNSAGRVCWVAICSCGTKKQIDGLNLRRGHTKSCGCLQREVVTTHGKSTSKMYRVWYQMHSRCSNKKDISYKDYGGNKGYCLSNCRWVSSSTNSKNRRNKAKMQSTHDYVTYSKSRNSWLLTKPFKSEEEAILAMEAIKRVGL